MKETPEELLPEELLKEYCARGYTSLSEKHALRLLEAAGIPFVSTQTAKTLSEALEAAENIGYPVVLKVLSPDITHKLDIGGVKLGLNRPSEVEQAWTELVESVTTSRTESHLEGVSVQAQVPTGVELIVGGVRDEQFGAVVMFGLGGVYTEALNDVVFRIAPLSSRQAQDMIRETLAQTLLSGLRGQPSVDLDFISQLIVRIGELLLEAEAIQELEVNPFIARPGEQGVAVDALVVLKPK